MFSGSSTFQNVKATNVEKGIVMRVSNFSIIDAGGNEGWNNNTFGKH